MRFRWKNFVALLAVWLTACSPLLRGHLPWRGDGILHLYRLAHLQRAVAHGDLYPRWLPDLAYGYGFPLFNYYAPLSYYISLPFAWLFSAETALTISYILAICLTGWGVYTWAQRIWQNERSAMLASALAVYSPYVLYNALERGALAEAWGIALLSASFSAVDALLRCPTRRNWVVTVAAVAALILTHNISALIGGPLLAIYVLLGRAGASALGGGFRPKILAIAAGLCGVGLSTFFWLPAIAEQNLVQIGRLINDPALDFRNHFLSAQTLLAWPTAADPTQVNPSVAFGLSLPALIFALMALVNRLRKPSAQRNGAQLAVLLGMTLLLIVFMLPFSQAAWELLPLLEFVQFPWRLLGAAALFMAVLGGGVATISQRQWVPNLLFVGVLLYGLFWLFPAFYQAPLDLSVAGSVAYELESGALGTTSGADYLPIAVEILPEPATRQLWGSDCCKLRNPDGTAEITESPRSLGTTATVTSADAWTLTYTQFYFEGWQASLDGDPLPLFAAEQSGLISAEIPAGTHTVSIEWGSTRVRRSAEIVSGVFLLIVLASPLLIKKNAAAKRTTLSAQTSGWQFAVLGIFLLALKLAWLDNTASVWRSPRLQGQAVLGADVAADANFADTFYLRGFDLSSGSLPADEPIPLTLYWQANNQAEFNPTVSVHLVDAQGRFFGQSGNYRPANFPVNRWQAGEYAADVHALQPLEATPPGEYLLRLFVLHEQTGARLDVRNAAGQPLGNSIDLGTVQLERGSSVLDSESEWLGDSAEIKLDLNAPLQATDVGDSAEMLLFWGASSNPTQTIETQFELHNAAGERVAVQPFTPLNAKFSMTDWRAGDRWRDPQVFRVPSLALDGSPLTSGDYALSVALGAETIALGQLAISAPERRFDLPPLQYPITKPVGADVLLLGYDLAEADAALALTLYWQPLRAVETSYVRFVHVLNADGVLVAQRDSVPERSTAGWISAEIITDSLTLQNHPEATHLVIGFYDPVTQQRSAEPIKLALP